MERLFTKVREDICKYSRERKKERKYDGSNKNIYLYETSINHNYDK